MIPSDKIILDLHSVMDKAIADFNGAIPGLQDDIFVELVSLIKELEIKNGIIQNSLSNLKTIGKIKIDLEKIILNPDYLERVNNFVATYNTVAQLQHDYFTAVVKDFSQPKIVAEIKKQAVNSSIDLLTDAGITANLIEPLQEILRQNITGGGSIKSFVTQIKSFILNNSLGDGALQRYAATITVDAIHGYSRQYMQAISDDLGFQWYQYVGSNIRTSREWCIHMTKKRWIHRSEFVTVINDNIDGVSICSDEIPCYDKTGLPRGMKDGTDQYNVLNVAGGWGCRHQFYGCPDNFVPENLRLKFGK